MNHILTQRQVIQEIVLCDNVQVWIGSQSQRWEDFVVAMCSQLECLGQDLADSRIPEPEQVNVRESFQTSIRNATNQVKSLDRLRILLRDRSSEGIDLLELLSSTSPLGVSNDLDRVYSLLGLSTPEYRRNIPIRYGITLSELFSTIVQYVVQRDRNLDLLFDQWPRSSGIRISPVTSRLEHTMEPFPTWMPDFSEVQQRDLQTVTQQRHQAGTFGWPNISTDSTTFVLNIVALAVDTVAETFDLLHDDRFEIPQQAQEFSDGDGTFSEALVHDDLVTKMARSIAGRNIVSSAKLVLRQFFTFSSQNKACYRTRRNSVSSAKLVLGHFLQLRSPRKVFFRTRTWGRLGFGSDVERGDELVVPLGASAPFVLRPDMIYDREQGKLVHGGVDWRRRIQTEKTWELVGDCYVEGVMDGELKDLLDPVEVESKEYRIR